MYLGPLVAVQQVLDPSLQTSHPLKEKKGGGAPPLQSSNKHTFSVWLVGSFVLYVKIVLCINIMCLS